jgi:sugar lactone lactonase YvrE
VVLAADQAGNVEAPPDGVLVPQPAPLINLGVVPDLQTSAEEPLPIAPPPADLPTNPLFIAAQAGVPQTAPSGTPFGTVLTPFAMGVFASNVPMSNAGVGPLGITFSPDGLSVYVTGGAARNQLFVFSRAGGAATTPLATLGYPLFDLAFDSIGQLWATTGGGPLVQLDPTTGQIVGQYGDSVELGLAADPDTHRLFVSTSKGISIFDTATHSFTPFSITRVDGLALAPDGTLWGATWPSRGQIVTFDSHGQATVMLSMENADGLAFGKSGTPLDGLLFVSHQDGGITAVDLKSLQTVDIATGGTRGDFVHVGPDGRLYVTQSNQVDVLFPVVAPHVIASDPVDASSLLPVVNTATFTFDNDLVSNSMDDSHSATNVANYTLVDLTRGQTLPIGAAVYDPAARTVQLFFESLAPNDQYQITVSTNIRSTLGLGFEQPFHTTFNVLQSIASVTPGFLNTRLDRGAGTVSFDVTLTNTQPFALEGPVQLVFAGLTAADMPTADGLTSDGHPYVIVLAAGELNPGQTSAAVTVTLANSDGHAVTLDPQISAALAPDVPPTFTSTAPTSATVGVPLLYQPTIDNPGALAVSYVLLAGPGSAALDASTGALTYTPSASDDASVHFDLRVYDARGGFAEQAWDVAIAAAHVPPVLLPVSTQTVTVGQPLVVQLGATAQSGQALVFGVDNLPPGAQFDAVAQSIRYTPAPGSAGLYEGVRVRVSDGTTTVSEIFSIIVTPAAVPPTLHLVDQAIRPGTSFAGCPGEGSPGQSADVQLGQSAGRRHAGTDDGSAVVDARIRSERNLRHPHHGVERSRERHRHPEPDRADRAGPGELRAAGDIQSARRQGLPVECAGRQPEPPDTRGDTAARRIDGIDGRATASHADAYAAAGGRHV